MSGEEQEGLQAEALKSQLKSTLSQSDTITSELTDLFHQARGLNIRLSDEWQRPQNDEARHLRENLEALAKSVLASGDVGLLDDFRLVVGTFPLYVNSIESGLHALKGTLKLVSS